MKRLLTAVIGAALLLAACGGDDPVRESAGPTGAFLDFVGTDVRGNEVDVSVYEGSELVVWFWAPW